jgi:hypothetical protein
MMEIRKRNLIIYLNIAFIIGILSGILIFSTFEFNFSRNSGEKTLYIAPYISTTHDCYTHAVGCQGESINLDLSYTIIGSDGDLYLTSSTTTSSNGFFSILVPSNHAYRIIITTEINNTQYQAYTQISSYDDSPDCITNAHLIKVI